MRPTSRIASLLWTAICTLLLGLGVARAVTPASLRPMALNSGPLFLPYITQTTIAPPVYAAWSGPLAVSPHDGSIWVVNPDAGTVSVIDEETLTLLEEVPVGGEPWAVAIRPTDGAIFVADRLGGTIHRINRATRTITHSQTVGSEPAGLVVSADGRRVYVALMAEGAVVALESTSLAVVGRVAVSPTPYALAITGPTATQPHERLLVTHLFGLPVAGTIEAEDDSRAGHISIIDISGIDTPAMALRSEIVLPPNVHGLPNMLASIAVYGERAWLPHLRATPSLPNGLTTTVFAAVTTLDLARNVEVEAELLPLNDQEIFGSPVNNPAAVAPSPDGRTLYLVHGGSDLLEVVDIATPTAPRLVKFLATGKNPRGIALDASGRRAYVMNYLSRSVSVFDLDTLTLVTEVTVTGETLAPDVLAGKILFHNASDPRLSRGAWVSCASCHFDGWPDGVTWIFPDGPRQSPMLWNAGETLPWHWSAALDEAQDVEETIRLIQHGLGLAAANNLQTLGAPLAGTSVALDQLAAFLYAGIRPPQIANLEAEAAPDALAAGRAHFISQGCNECHNGATWTTSSMPGAPGTLDADGDGTINDVLHDVGTYTPRDVRGKGGFDVPSLLGIGLTAPYFHDGSARTLEDVLNSGHPTPAAGLPPLDTSQLEELILFLRTIGPSTQTVPAP